MKKSFLTIALIWGISHIAFAKNTTTQVEQVTSAITLSEDVTMSLLAQILLQQQVASILPIKIVLLSF